VSYIGSYIGGGRDAVGALWVRINRDVPIIGAIGDVIATRYAATEATLRQIETAFDISTATGAALDAIGALLGVARLGLADAVYRRLVQIQAVLVLSGASTRDKIVRVFETWTQAAADEYRGDGRTIEIGGDIDPADESRLLTLMRRVKPAGRRVRVYAITADDLVADYALDPVGTTTTTDYALDPVAGAAPTAEPVT